MLKTAGHWPAGLKSVVLVSNRPSVGHGASKSNRGAKREEPETPMKSGEFGRGPTRAIGRLGRQFQLPGLQLQQARLPSASSDRDAQADAFAADEGVRISR